MDAKKKPGRGGLVYSTGPSPIDWNDDSSRSDTPPSGPREAVLRIERSGRGGKTVTVIELRGVSASDAKTLGKRLKNMCGAGGTVKGVVVELQGDLRGRVRDLLGKEGLRVKG